MSKEEDNESPNLNEVLYGQLDLPEIQVSNVINATVRDELIVTLLKARILTKEQVLATLERAEQKVVDACNLPDKPLTTYDLEIIERMKNQAKLMCDRIRKLALNESFE